MCDEEASFRSRCASKIRTWHERRHAWHGERGLVIRWRTADADGVHGKGIGHLLALVYRLHSLCIHVERYCYISLYDSLLEDYFGYADAALPSWKPPNAQSSARTYGVEKRMSLTLNVSNYVRWHAETTLRSLPRILAAQNANRLIELTIHGVVPSVHMGGDHTAMLTRFFEQEAEDGIAWINRPTDAGLHRFTDVDPCLCRYVTQRRLQNRPHAPTPFPRRAVHLRTGLADWEPLPQREEDKVKQPLKASPSSLPTFTSNGGQLRPWVAVACDGAVGGGGQATGKDMAAAAAAHSLWHSEPVFALSDSSYLLRTLRAANPLVRTLPSFSLWGREVTRSWEVGREAKFRALDAIVAGGRAITLYVAPQRMHCFCSSNGGGGRHRMQGQGLKVCPRYWPQEASVASSGDHKTHTASKSAGSGQAGAKHGGAGDASSRGPAKGGSTSKVYSNSSGSPSVASAAGAAKQARPRRRVCDSRHWSSFYLPLVARSHCLQAVALSVPGCAGFESTYLRDLPILARKVALSEAATTSGVRQGRAEALLAGLRWSLGSGHPCANLTGRECHGLLRMAA